MPTPSLDEIRARFMEAMRKQHLAPPDVAVQTHRGPLPGQPSRDPKSLGLLAGK